MGESHQEMGLGFGMRMLIRPANLVEFVKCLFRRQRWKEGLPVILDLHVKRIETLGLNMLSEDVKLLEVGEIKVVEFALARAIRRLESLTDVYSFPILECLGSINEPTFSRTWYQQSTLK